MPSQNQIEVSLRLSLDQWNEDLRNSVSSMRSAGKKMTSIGKSLSKYITAPIVATGTAAVATAVKFEKLSTSLEVLTGSAEAGAAQFERIKEFSAATPFQLGDLVSVNNQLMGFGLNADQAFNSLKMLGDIASVSGANLDRVAVAFGQSAAAGRVMTQDLNQFVNNGIPIYQLLGDVTGKNVSELRELASEGEITFDLLEKAFKKGTSEGGKFYKGTEKLSKTLGGELSTLRDNFSLMLDEIGQIIGEGLRPLMEIATDLIARFKGLDKGTKRMIVVIGGLAAVIGPLIAAIGVFVSTVLPALIVGMTALTGPVGILVAVITALGIALAVDLAMGYKKATKEAINLREVHSDISKGYVNETAKLRVLQSQIAATNKGSKERLELINQLKASYGQYIQGAIDENTELTKLKDTYLAINKAIREKVALDVTREKQTELVRRQLEKESQVFDMFEEKAQELAKTTPGLQKHVDRIRMIQANYEEVSRAANAVRTSFVFPGQEAESSGGKMVGVNQELVESYKILNEALKVFHLESETAFSSFDDYVKDLVNSGKETEELMTKLMEAVAQYGVTQENIKEKTEETSTATRKLNQYLDATAMKMATIGEESKHWLDPDEIIDRGLAPTVDPLPWFSEFVAGATAEMDALQSKAQTVGAAVSNAFMGMGYSIANSLGLASDGMQGFLRVMLSTAVDLIGMALANSIASAIQGAQQSSTATGPAAVFTQEAFIAKSVGGVLAAFAAIPKFADGALVYGPTLGLMGEYSGASNNPEVIAPLSDLKNIIGDDKASGSPMFSRVKGTDLILATERASRTKSRITGR